ncbi:MAG: enoyl-CoA hydratase/isomerase family protein [Legionella sp.]
MTEDVLFSQEEQIGIITLNRPKALNALNVAMIMALEQQLSVWDKADEIKAIVIRAVAGNAFCAGGDVRWLHQMRDNRAEQLSFFWHEYRLNHMIHNLSKPYIALMDGMTMGGGVGIALHGSHPVASERFVFAMPETSIGLFPDIGASYLLNRCPDAQGVYLGLTGDKLDAHAALRAGLVKHVVSSEYMAELIDTLKRADLAADAHSRVSHILQTCALHDDSANDRHSIDAVNQLFAKPSLALIINALSNHPDVKMQQIALGLSHKSPLSLAVTFEQLKRAKGLSLAQCLAMDFILVGHFMAGHDFYEGIRALLIDKDKNPEWNPARLDLVNETQVSDYFTVLEQALDLT